MPYTRSQSLAARLAIEHTREPHTGDYPCPVCEGSGHTASRQPHTSVKLAATCRQCGGRGYDTGRFRRDYQAWADRVAQLDQDAEDAVRGEWVRCV